MLFPQLRSGWPSLSEHGPDQMIMVGVRTDLDRDAMVPGAIFTEPPPEAARALLETAKPRFQALPNNHPMLFMRNKKGRASMVWGPGNLSFAKAVTWATAWVRKTEARRYALCGITWAETTEGAAVMLEAKRKKVLLWAAVDDRAGELAFVASEALGDPHGENRVDGFNDDHRCSLSMFRWLLVDVLKKPKPG